MGGHVFISHSTRDDQVVTEIRQALEPRGLTAWIDSRELAGGDPLRPEIQKAIDDASHLIAVLSPEAVNSAWVREEIQYALRRQKRRKDGFKVIPVLLPGIKPSALGLWFGEEPVAVRVEVGPGGVEAALPQLLAALGAQLPRDAQASQRPETTPIAELILDLSQPSIFEEEGKRRAKAVAVVRYDPPEADAPEISSPPFHLVAPLGPIEADDLAWYLERYFRWPAGVFLQRAQRIEASLPQWGRSLYDAALGADAAREPLYAWRNAPRGVERRFSVLVDPTPLDPAEEAVAHESATLLLSLPWELIHDGQAYLFAGWGGVRVRRQLPNRSPKDPILTDPPIRVLLVSPRPEDERARYIDHRASARPLVHALARLGALARLDILSPPTFAALQQQLQRAADAGEPYHVVHFDGHGVYDRTKRDGLGGRLGLGALVFEHPNDSRKLFERRSDVVHAERLAEVVRGHRTPLFFLEACQTAMAEKDPKASVANRMLEGGVASVAAMSHSVLVETSRRFVTAFYEDLMTGRRIGQAMLAGQQALRADTRRGRAFTGELHMQDWFVPVLFQEELDPQLVREVPSEQVQREIQRERRLALGELPEPPKHTFVGRSRDLLAAERLLCGRLRFSVTDWPTPPTESARYVVLRGEGGEGKTTLAVELARWLVLSHRFRRAASVSLEHALDGRAVLWAIGRQLVPDFASQAGSDDRKAEQLVERALDEHATIIVLDNMESVLPPRGLSQFSRSENTPPLPLGEDRGEGCDAEDESQSSGSENGSRVPSGEGGGENPVGEAGKRQEEAGLEPSEHDKGVSEAVSAGAEPYEPEILQKILALCGRLAEAGHTRLVFTSREPLPAPFDDHHLRIDRLARSEAIELVGKVLGEGERMPRAADDLESERQIEELVDAVNCHARALVLVTRELVDRGISQTTADLSQIMADLGRRYPDDRERSLFASVELSLRRLPPEVRKKLGPLGVFHGGGHLDNIGVVLGLDLEHEEELAVGEHLVKVGLAERLDYGYLRLHPALGPALLREVSDEERAAATERWAEATAELAGVLYEQWFKEAHVGATLTLLELPNLLAALEYRFAQASAAESATDAPPGPSFEGVVQMATQIEALLEYLGRARALERAADIRRQAAEKLADWSHARYLAEDAAVDRLLDAGRYGEAAVAAQRLLERAQEAGEKAYEDAAYDIAMAHSTLGRTLNLAGDAQAALVPLDGATRRFQNLADGGDEAARMASVCLSDYADCLTDLGRLDEAVLARERTIEDAKARGDERMVASSTGQLGTLRMSQERYAEALVAWHEARRTFERLGEPKSVATAWHQIGMVHQKARQHEAAEEAYKQALQIRVQHGFRSNEAETLGQLGNLYSALGQGKEAVRFYQQAAEIFADPQIADLAKQGTTHHNIADELIKLNCYPEARAEIERAIECQRPFGHTAEPWKTFGILSDLERAEGNAAAAAAARQQAIDAYLGYRRDGGQSQLGGYELVGLAEQAINQGQPGAAKSELGELGSEWAPDHPGQPLIAALVTILDGSRDPGLAADPNLDYGIAAELQLLLERLERGV